MSPPLKALYNGGKQHQLHFSLIFSALFHFTSIRSSQKKKMEDQCSWSLYYPEEGMEEYLKHSLLYTTLELESTIFSAREEIARKDDELEHFKILLAKTINERDEAVAKCKRLMFEKLLLQQMQQQKKKQLVESSVAEPSRICGLIMSTDDSSDCDENGMSAFELTDMMEKIEPKKPLPEKGKFLQAVMEAGPLLQTLLLAGPLPQWQHPPPHLSSIDIPPVTISSSPRPPPPPRQLLHLDSCLSTTNGGGGGGGGTGDGYVNKRALSNSDLATDFSPIFKHQRVAHQSSLTPTSNPIFS